MGDLDGLFGTNAVQVQPGTTTSAKNARLRKFGKGHRARQNFAFRAWIAPVFFLQTTKIQSMGIAEQFCNGDCILGLANW